MQRANRQMLVRRPDDRREESAAWLGLERMERSGIRDPETIHAGISGVIFSFGQGFLSKRKACNELALIFFNIMLRKDYFKKIISRNTE